MTPARRSVLILDFGSQYTQLIARRARELGVHSAVIPGDASLERIRSEGTWGAVILSGGPASVYEPGAPGLAPGVLDHWLATRAPVLGICYGMQLLARDLGGEVAPGQAREYGRAAIQADPDSALLGEMREGRFHAWMSHGDEIRRAPDRFVIAARSESGIPAALESKELGVYALQFHPEVAHTEGGTRILKRFLREIASIPADWTVEAIESEQTRVIAERIGLADRVVCALSGGVDSTVAAALVHKAIGDRLHCVFVDHGLLRHREGDRVMALFREKLGLPVTRVDASARFLARLEGVEDPEEKRRRIGAEFVAVFEDEAERIGRESGLRPDFLLQGTLYPDVIESSPRGTHRHSTTIKTHHNVGGLPERMRLKLLEPLRDLFKDEVRALGERLGVPAEFLRRHPFPGPGLAVRVLGAVTPEALEALRAADEIFIDELRSAHLYDRIWQAFVVYLPVKSVGVQGDGRTHANVVALRAVTSSDGMTADWFPFEPAFLARVSNRICNEVRGVNRVVLDISSKPPATIEWE